MLETITKKFTLEKSLKEGWQIFSRKDVWHLARASFFSMGMMSLFFIIPIHFALKGSWIPELSALICIEIISVTFTMKMAEKERNKISLKINELKEIDKKLFSYSREQTMELLKSWIPYVKNKKISFLFDNVLQEYAQNGLTNEFYLCAKEFLESSKIMEEQSRDINVNEVMKKTNVLRKELGIPVEGLADNKENYKYLL